MSALLRAAALSGVSHNALYLHWQVQELAERMHEKNYRIAYTVASPVAVPRESWEYLLGVGNSAMTGSEPID